MKKAIVLLALFTLTLFAFGVCGIHSAEAAKIIIRANVASNPKATPDLPTIHWYQSFVDEMTKRVPDDAEVKIYWDAQLARTYAEGINSAQNQMIQMMNIPAASLAEYSKAMIPLNALFVVPYPHNEIARKAFQGPLGEKIRQKVIEDTHLRVVSFWDFGFRHILSKDKPINTVEDLNGLKIRCQPNPVQLAAFKAFGCNPTPITWAELFTSLQQGVVSATENPLVNLYQARLYEVTKYLSLTGHLLDYNVLLVNEQWYQALPEKVRKAFDESAAIADEVYVKQLDASEKKFMELAKEKMDVREVSSVEIEKLREIGHPASKEEVVKQVGQEYYDYFMGEFARIEKEYLGK